MFDHTFVCLVLSSVVFDITVQRAGHEVLDKRVLGLLNVGVDLFLAAAAKVIHRRVRWRPSAPGNVVHLNIQYRNGCLTSDGMCF